MSINSSSLINVSISITNMTLLFCFLRLLVGLDMGPPNSWLAPHASSQMMPKSNTKPPKTPSTSPANQSPKTPPLSTRSRGSSLPGHMDKKSPDIIVERMRIRGSEGSPLYPISPLAKEEIDTDEKTEQDAKPKGHSLKRCPCGTSSGGQLWQLECKQCTQKWHSSCANLKGRLSKAMVESIDQWQCPWCFTSPYTPPRQHKSYKSTSKLQETVITDSMITEISESLSEALSTELKDLFVKNDKRFDSLKVDLEQLSAKVNAFGTEISRPISDHLQDFHVTEPEFNCEEPEPVTEYRNNFLPEDSATEIKNYLKENISLFRKSKGRSTLVFGEEYAYSGSKDKPMSKTIPAPLVNLVDKITESYSLTGNMIPNSVLVNHYPGKLNGNSPASELPAHSDDELEIEPGSSIYTYSCGGTRTLTFTSKHSESSNSVDAFNNSLYVMTKQSQAFHKHQMLDTDACEERFSITLRHVNKLNRRSMLLVGDSNTKEVKFGAGRGSVGEKYPGKRLQSSRIANIDPAKCTEYANVIVVCGTNDLRPAEVQGNPSVYIKNLVCCLEGKLEQIRLLSNAKIFFMPVLPTRDARMNKLITEFNQCVIESKFMHRLNIWMPPVYSLLDQRHLLDNKLTRDGDSIHLGNFGITKFVRLIKEAVYHRERAELNSVNQQRYPETPSTGLHRPVR